MRRNPRVGLARWSALAVLLALGFAASGCGALKRCAYSGLGRDDWQQPEKVMAALAVEPGDHVADLGAGGGYFTFRLAEAVGPEGRVYAIDVDPDMTGHLRERAEDEGTPQVVVIDAVPDDPRIPEGGADLVLVTNTYHHLEDRVAYFARLRERLRAGGRVAIIEPTGEGGGFPAGHATGPDAIRDELAEAGYRLDERHAFLERQSFQIFSAEP